MTTTVPSGLGATWGIAQETTVGTIATPTRFLPMISDKVVGSKKTVQSAALHNGGLYELGSRRRLVMHEAKGQVELDLTDRGLGLLLKNMIGSTASPVQQGGSAAYLQQHVPGDTLGLSLTLQSGRPDITGTVRPFTYNGAKVTDWEISVSTAGLAKLTCSFDAWDEATGTAYAAPSYTASNALSWVDASLLLGGAVSTTAGIATVTGGTAPVGTVKSVSIKGQNGLALDRQQVGSLTKREALSNAFRKYSGQMVVEFANLTELYNLYYADTSTTLVVQLQGSTAIASTYFPGLTIICPQIFLDGAPPATEGPGVLQLTVPFTILDDGTDPPIQFNYMSKDTTL